MKNFGQYANTLCLLTNGPSPRNPKNEYIIFAGRTLSKNAPELQELSSYLNKRSDIIGFIPRNKFYQELSATKFRNMNGISR